MIMIIDFEVFVWKKNALKIYNGINIKYKYK